LASSSVASECPNTQDPAPSEQRRVLWSIRRALGRRLRDFGGLRTLQPLDNLDLDDVAFDERPEAVALNRTEVHEHIRATVPALRDL
jgi:hypothetical protein